MKSWYQIKNKAPDCTEVMIYDEIGGWGISAKTFVEELAAVKSKTITLKLNSPGGAVFDGFAIYNALKDHPATVNVRVEGIAASIACVIAMAGDTCAMAKNAMMMMHNALAPAFGYADDLRKTADLLDKLSGSIAETYASKTGKKLSAVKKLMDDETWFSAAEAKAAGMCDSIIGDDDEDQDADNLSQFTASAVNAALKFTKHPDRLKRIAASLNATTHTPRKTETGMNQIMTRDSKLFVNIDGKEHEVGYAAAPAAASPAAAPVPAASNAAAAPAASAQTIEAAKAEAVKEEREYAKNFNTALATAGITGKAAETFTNDFYGRKIEDVKFLAGHAIGNRAKPVGEGAGEPEKKAETVDPDKAIADAATERFHNSANVRGLFGVQSEPKTSDKYKNALERYVKRSVQAEKDLKANPSKLETAAA